MSKLEANIELIGLQSIAEESLNKILSQTIEETVSKIINTYIETNYKNLIEEQVSTMIKTQLDDVLYNYKIQIGGDYLSKEPVREVTIAELTNEKVREYITNNQFTTEDRYGNYRHIETFQEYVDDKLNLNTKIKRELDNFIKDTRYNINKKMQEMFDDSTRTLLSDSILNLLQQNETYRRIETNISSIANKNDEE